MLVEQLFCVICGVCLLVIGIALAKVAPPNWTSKLLNEDETRRVELYSRCQRVLRRCNNLLISILGASIVMTAALPHGRVWLWAWAGIFVLILCIVALALVDAISSLLAYRHCLPSTMRATLGEDSKQT